MRPERAGRLAAALLLTWAALAAGGCRRQPPPAPAPPPAPPQQAVRFNLGAEPATLDPARAADAVSTTVIYQVFEGLTRRSPRGVEPGLAVRWEVAPDGRRYVFHLREAYWSDGVPVTAGDFEYAWKRALDPVTDSPYASLLYFLKGGEEYHRAARGRREELRAAVGVRALDDRTLEVELREPAPFFPELVSTFPYLPVPRHKVEQDRDGWWRDPRRFAGSGPFRPQEWGRGRLVLVKNELYWDRRSVVLREVTCTAVADPEAAVSAFEAGEVDVGMPRQVPLGEVARLQAAGQVRQAPLYATYFLAFNVTRPPFQDPRVRRAFSLAIDRRALVAEVLQGLPQPALALVPPGGGQPDFRAEGGDYLRDGDLETARQLLAQAGYPEGRGFPRVTLLYNTDGEQQKIMEALARRWREGLGVEVQLAGADWDGYWARREAGDFHLVRVGWVGEYADPAAFLGLFRSADPRNFARWRSAAYDALLDQAAGLPPEPRREALHRAEALLMQESPVAPVYFYVQFWFQRETVEGVFVDLQGNPFLRTARVAAPPAGAGGAAGGGR